MNPPSTQRTVILGTSLAAILVVAILVLAGGREPAPAPVPAPAGEAALPMLEGVNQTAKADQTLKAPTETPAEAGSKPASAAPVNH